MSDDSRISELLPMKDLPESQYMLLQSRLYMLLGEQTERYTMGESTSVTVETAQELLSSLCYTLSVALGNDRGCEKLLSCDPASLLKKGQELLKTKLAELKELWSKVCRTAPNIPNSYYRDTLKGIGVYLDHYDLYFFAHSRPACIDYPLMVLSFEKLQGLNYTEMYLKCMLAENVLLSKFDSVTVAKLLRKVFPNYEDHYMNLCEQPLINAIGLAAVGKPFTGILIDEGDMEMITERLGDSDKLRKGIDAAISRIYLELGFSDGFVLTYLLCYAEMLVPRIGSVLDTGDLSGVFISGA